MNKNLLLIRHAKSDWSVQGQKDFDRSLNNRGFRDAPRMGYRLAQRGLAIDQLIASPAIRAKLTAEFFAEQLKIDTEKILFNEQLYDASLRVLIQEITKFDDSWNYVAIFGHNPGLSYLVEYLSGQSLGELATCAIVALELHIDTWQAVSKDTASVLFHEYPKLYEHNLESED